ncbi:MAG: S-layer homology domain-containing protein [Clostridia bacterium]|nr:S-layer homology domain-containing protein [Clostridia bacterium]
MKKKLKGLLALWLSLAMLMSSAQAFASNWYVYNGDVPAEAAGRNGLWYNTTEFAGFDESKPRNAQDIGGTPVTLFTDPVTVEHKHKVCGAECADPNHSEHGDIIWTAWNSDNSLPTTAGNYYLTTDVTIDNSYIVPNGETSLCLNGHTLQSTDTSEDGKIINIWSNTELNLCDCSENNAGKITGSVPNGVVFSRLVIGETSAPVFNMYGGTISGINYANPANPTGAAVNITTDNAEFHMYGGKITDNGAVGVNASEKFFLSGTVDISNNGSSYAQMISAMSEQLAEAGINLGNIGENIDIAVEQGKTVQLESPVTMTNKSSIFMQGGDMSFCGTFTQGWNEKMNGKNPADYFISTADAFTVKLNDSGEAELAVMPAHSHDMSVECGNDNAIGFDHALTSQDGKLYIDGAVVEPDAGNSSIYLPDGNYYLAENVTPANIIEIRGNVNLCLNGHTLDMGEKCIILKKTTDGTAIGNLNLCDCGEGGTITGTYYGGLTDDALIRVENEFSMYGGSVINTSNNELNNKQAVSTFSGTVRLYGGEVVSLNDNAVCVDGSKGGLSLSGEPKITGAADKADIYLANEYYDKIITLDAPLTNTEPYRVGAEHENTFTSGWSEHMGTAVFSDYFISATKGRFIAKDENNELKIYDYAITEQPSAENNYTVTANGATDYAPTSYKWYLAEVVTKDITDQNAFNYEYNGSTSSYDTVTGLWTGVNGMDNLTSYYFTILNLSKGDVVKIKPSDTLNNYTYAYLENDDDRLYTKTTNENGEYEFTVPADGQYTFSFNSGNTPTVKATVIKTNKKGEVKGQTTNQLTAVYPGSYLCEVSYEDYTLLTSDVFEYTPSAPPAEHKHDMSVTCGHDNEIVFDKVLTADEDGWLYINDVAATTDETSDFILSEGNYYIKDNLSLRRGLRINDDVNLCLNGKTLEFQNNYTIYVQGHINNINFNICDCQTGGKITGAYSSTAEHVGIIDNRHTMSLYGGTIENSSTDNSEGYYQYAIANANILNLYGGEVISKNDNAIVSSNFCMKINLAGATKIKGADSASDIFLYKSDDYIDYGDDYHLALILISDTFANAELTEPYRVSADSVEQSADFTRGWSEKMGDKEIGKYFVSAMKGYDIKKNTDGELEFVLAPSPSPSVSPSASPSVSPSPSPSASPSPSPSVSPSPSPSVSPSPSPTAKPKRKGGSGTKATPTPKPTVTPTVSPTAEPDSSPNPTDTPSGSEKKHKAYIFGYEGYFYPDGQITRAETAAILARLTDGFEENGNYNTSFTDSVKNLWYHKYIGFMENRNVISGYDNGEFRPENNITRAEFAAMIAKYADLSGTDANVTFDDIGGHWAEEVINACCNAGYTEGYDSKFRPDEFITRAEAVSIMNRMLDRNDIKNAENPFYDVAMTHWAYKDIMEAAVEHSVN